jgi:hypothetical protein
MSLQTSQRRAVETMDRLFQARRYEIPVLARRADAEGITAITTQQDMVPLLFPHTTYKSYPHTLVTKGQWAQMNRWLDSLSTYRVDDVDVSGVEDVDTWIERLHAAGHLVSSSSGTSGKGSFLNKTQHDREVSLGNLLDCLTELGLPPDPVWHMLAVGPDTGISHHMSVRELLKTRYGRADGIAPPTSTAPQAHHAYMARLVAMRRAMAEGTAAPDNVAAFEAEMADRQREVEERLRYLAQRILEHRGERIFFNATFPLLYRLSEILRELGATEGKITGDNALTTGGGLKGIALPADYQARIFGLLHIAPERFLHYYSMQELNLRLPKCLEGRYHVPKELVLFVLDKEGESLAPLSDGVVEGRAAFFDTTVDGRWGGTISGDRIIADLGPCPCGKSGPTVLDEITRYSDLPDGDKITCAGTIDAYVRGFIES